LLRAITLAYCSRHCNALLIVKNVPGDEIVYNDLADEILNYPPEQGYLTISNALQSTIADGLMWQ